MKAPFNAALIHARGILELCRDGVFKLSLDRLLTGSDFPRLTTLTSAAAATVCRGNEAAQPWAASLAVTALLRTAIGALDNLQDGDDVPEEFELPDGMNLILALLLYTSRIIADCTDLPPETRLTVQREQTDMLVRMGDGQHRELKNRSALSLQAYMEIVADKSAGFARWECRLPALLAQSPPQATEALSRIGEAIGYIHHLAGDCRGLQTEPYRRSDIGRHWTAPVVYAWSQSTEQEQEAVSRLWQDGDEEAVRRRAIAKGGLTLVATVAAYQRQVIEQGAAELRALSFDPSPLLDVAADIWTELHARVGGFSDGGAS